MQTIAMPKEHISFDAVATCVVVPRFETDAPILSALLRPQDATLLNTLAEQKTLSGKTKRALYIPTPGAPYAGILALGLGKREKFDPEALRRAAGGATALLGSHRISKLVLDLTAEAELPANAFIEGVILGQYDFTAFKEVPQESDAPVKIAEIAVAAQDDAHAARLETDMPFSVITSLSANAVRDLANTPANVLTPQALADWASELAASADPPCECTVLDETQMASLGMNALLGVAQGSAEAPKLILLHYKHPAARRTVALVGKGITFDTGGISLKPGEDMHEMKYDMCGAAAVLGAFMALLELKPALNVLCVVPAAENKPGGNAQRPGDIVRACNGVTIEVNNTDAEGRLILSDALAYTVDKYRPDAMIDVATLTGAAIVALGHHAAALLGSDEVLLASIVRAANATGERVWRLPLWDDFDDMIEGTHADLCNIGPARQAGTILGGMFLKHFTGETPWAHLDIAGTAWGGKHQPHLNEKHATGYGVRLLTRWLLDEAAHRGVEAEANPFLAG